MVIHETKDHGVSKIDFYKYLGDPDKKTETIIHKHLDSELLPA